MIKLDEFSRKFNVNLKLLLHFEKENLLLPVYFDKESGLKYYTDNLIYRVKKIILYKRCGYKLGEIREIINLCFDKEDNEIQNEEIIIQLIYIHNIRVLEEIAITLNAKDYKRMKHALNRVNNLILKR